MKAQRLKIFAGLLTKRNETVAVAESVTSGLIMATLSLAKDATKFLQGGVVAYNLGQKTRQLGVDPILADASNCVSESIACDMARQVALSFRSQWGIAITGYAVPVPALKIKTCFAYVAFAHNDQPVLTLRIDTKLKGQERIQRYYVNTVIERFIKELAGDRYGT